MAAPRDSADGPRSPLAPLVAPPAPGADAQPGMQIVSPPPASVALPKSVQGTVAKPRSARARMLDDDDDEDE